MHIDKMCLQQNATQMLRVNTVPSPWGELTKYKCLVPAQNRLPNALALVMGDTEYSVIDTTSSGIGIDY